MDKLLASLSQFNRREQTALLIGGLLIAFYLLWMVVLSPLNNKRDLLIKATTNMQQSLGRVQVLARQLEQLAQQSNQASVSGDNLSGLIDASLRDNGMTMSSFIPGTNGEVRVRIDKVATEPMMQWLHDLESKYHIAIRELSITASNDPGQVSINLRLVKP
jgi:general secretion pathway protein M